MIKQMEDKTRQSRARQRPSLICGVSAHTFFHTHSYTDATRGCVSFLCLFVPYDPSFFFAAALRLFFFSLSFLRLSGDSHQSRLITSFHTITHTPVYIIYISCGFFYQTQHHGPAIASIGIYCHQVDLRSTYSLKTLIAIQGTFFCFPDQCRGCVESF